MDSEEKFYDNSLSDRTKLMKLEIKGNQSKGMCIPQEFIGPITEIIV